MGQPTQGQDGGAPVAHSERHATCELYGIRVVDALPRRCPMQAVYPLDVLLEWKNAGFAALRDHDHHRGNDLLHRSEVCFRCSTRLRLNQTVRHLRGENQNAA